MTDRELMQQALDALKFGLHVGFDESSESQIKKGGKAFDQHSKAITALRERLAQPEQEPFGYFQYDPRLDAWVQNREGRPGTPFYTTPPQRQWVDLTDAEIDALMPPADGSAGTHSTKAEIQPGLWGVKYNEVDAWSLPLVREVIRAIEAKLKENT